MGRQWSNMIQLGGVWTWEKLTLPHILLWFNPETKAQHSTCWIGLRKQMLCIFYHVWVLRWCRLLKSLLMGNKDPPISSSACNDVLPFCFHHHSALALLHPCFIHLNLIIPICSKLLSYCIYLQHTLTLDLLHLPSTTFCLIASTCCTSAMCFYFLHPPTVFWPGPIF